MSKIRKKEGGARRAGFLLRTAMAAMVALAACFVAGCGEMNQPAAPAGTGVYPAEYQAQFKDLWNQNNDFKGYLTLEGTQLGSPVVQAADNAYYEQRGFDGRDGGSVPLEEQRQRCGFRQRQRQRSKHHREKAGKRHRHGERGRRRGCLPG